MVAPDIMKERRLDVLEVLRHPNFHYGVAQSVRCTQYFSYPLRRLSPNLWFVHHTHLAQRERSWKNHQIEVTPNVILLVYAGKGYQ